MVFSAEERVPPTGRGEGREGKRKRGKESVPSSSECEAGSPLPALGRNFLNKSESSQFSNLSLSFSDLPTGSWFLCWEHAPRPPSGGLLILPGSAKMPPPQRGQPVCTKEMPPQPLSLPPRYYLQCGSHFLIIYPFVHLLIAITEHPKLQVGKRGTQIELVLSITLTAPSNVSGTKSVLNNCLKGGWMKKEGREEGEGRKRRGKGKRGGGEEGGREEEAEPVGREGGQGREEQKEGGRERNGEKERGGR